MFSWPGDSLEAFTLANRQFLGWEIASASLSGLRGVTPHKPHRRKGTGDHRLTNQEWVSSGKVPQEIPRRWDDQRGDPRAKYRAIGSFPAVQPEVMILLAMATTSRPRLGNLKHFVAAPSKRSPEIPTVPAGMGQPQTHITSPTETTFILGSGTPPLCRSSYINSQIPTQDLQTGPQVSSFIYPIIHTSSFLIN